MDADIEVDVEKINAIFDRDLIINVESSTDFITENKNKLERLKQKIDDILDNLRNLSI